MSGKSCTPSAEPVFTRVVPPYCFGAHGEKIFSSAGAWATRLKAFKACVAVVPNCACGKFPPCKIYCRGGDEMQPPNSTLRDNLFWEGGVKKSTYLTY